MQITKKKKDIDICAQDVNKILDFFYHTINPNINYANKTERKAVESLLKQFSMEELIKIIKYAISIQNEKYAPIITTPFQLKEKLAKLKIYWRRNKRNKGKNYDEDK